MLIRPADDADELIAEGAALHHCVGGYADRMADGETAIFSSGGWMNRTGPIIRWS